MTVNRIKLSLVIAPLLLVLVIVVYVYSLWSADRKKTAELPVEAASQMMRDLLKFHQKRGGFPEDLKRLEGVIWEKKDRSFSVGNRALNLSQLLLFLHPNIAASIYALGDSDGQQPRGIADLVSGCRARRLPTVERRGVAARTS